MLESDLWAPPVWKATFMAQMQNIGHHDRNG